MVNVNDFKGCNDSEIINNAIKGRHSDGIVIIPPREQENDKERKFWLLDSAILLPENTVVILQNCKIKLSDNCRDNFFRTANCGMGIEFCERISNVHIKGEGLCILEGADRPRATGDASKLIHAPCPHKKEDLCKIADWIPEEKRKAGQIDFRDIHDHSYGTDAGKPEESQYGDWRGIGVLFACISNFSISNIKIVRPHGWGISIEDGANGIIEKIDFDATMYKEIDGMLMNMENQDGIDIRNGCHHITISEITGNTGDDVIALTAIKKGDYKPGGSLRNTHVMHNDWTKRNCNIHDITIRNVCAHSYLCYPIRLLPGSTHIYNVIIDGITDPAPNCYTIVCGTFGTYGDNFKDGLRNIIVTNVNCHSKAVMGVHGYLLDSVVSNVINKNPEGKIFDARYEDSICNVQCAGCIEHS
ncbi:MAG: hypothetical protein E7583_06645 [Ruminococcaceae bacterium]|nr:hypothetical protein [Oscillospiraceae bacterium]